MDVAPVGAVRTIGGVGPHPVAVGGVELLTDKPAGRLSLMEKSVRSVSLGAVMSILKRELPPAWIVDGENDLIAATSVPVITTVAVPGRRFPIPCSVVSPSGGMTFLKVPEAVSAGAVISMDILQVPGLAGLPAGMVPPDNIIEVDVVETVPPQVLSVIETTVNGGGKSSVRLTPV